jgi:hypothetical protein
VGNDGSSEHDDEESGPLIGDAAIRNILISAAVMRAAGILVAHSKLGGRRRTGLPNTIEVPAKKER